MTRIIAGRYGGRRLATPPGQGTRPTSDRVREALFNALDTLVDLPGCRFVDLYAGSGAVGLEAASRGAEHVLLVEADQRAARTVRHNIATLGAAGIARLATAKVQTTLVAGPEGGAGYDVVFADPPYHLPESELAALLDALVKHGWLGADGVVVLERSTRGAEPSWVPGIIGERSRRYGETTLWYGRRS